MGVKGQPASKHVQNRARFLERKEKFDMLPFLAGLFGALCIVVAPTYAITRFRTAFAAKTVDFLTK